MQQGPTISTAAGATAAAAAAAATAESGSSGTRKDGGSELLVVDAVSMIRTRRLNQREHTDDEIRAWIEAYTATPTTTSSAAGTAGGPVAVVGAVGVPEYQMAAWLMAVCLHGLSARETAVLTRCMVDSGVRLQWDNHNNDCNCSSSDSSGIIHPQHPRLPLVDKHSTGGTSVRYSKLFFDNRKGSNTTKVAYHI